MTKKGSLFLKPAVKACKRYYIETSIFVGDIGITRDHLKSKILVSFSEIEKIIISLVAKPTGRLFIILVEFEKDKIPSYYWFKGKFLDIMTSFGSFFDRNDFKFNSVNNLKHAVSLISRNDMDMTYYGFPEDSKFFSGNYRIEQWIRKRAILGTFDMNEDFKKLFKKVRSIRSLVKPCAYI